MLKVIADENYNPLFNAPLCKMANISEVELIEEKDAAADTFIVKTTQYFVPVGSSIDVAEELKKLEADLAYQQGFLRTVMGKLNNEKFMAHAPANVVANEQNKKNDAESKIKALNERIEALRNM